jgi:hypothetical protein
MVAYTCDKQLDSLDESLDESLADLADLLAEEEEMRALVIIYYVNTAICGTNKIDTNNS